MPETATRAQPDAGETMATQIDVGQLIDDRKFGVFHVVLLVAAFLLMMMDGFDLGAAAVAGAPLVKEFGVSREALGGLFSAGLFAGLFGPPSFGYLADHFGRKKLIIFGAAFFGLFTLLSVWATSFTELVILRFIAGMGISGMMTVVVALVAEYAPRRVRSTLVVLAFSGVTLGGGLPGIAAHAYMPEYGWRIMFWIGGIGPITLAVVMAFILPESCRYLALRPHRRAELIATLKRVQPALVIPADAVFVIHGEHNRQTVSPKALFQGRLAWLTPLFWVSSAMCLMILFFVNQWTPTLLAQSGYDPSQSALATTVFQFAGTISGLVVMRPLDRYGFIPVPILFAIGVPTLIGVGLAISDQTLVMVLLGLAGFCLLGLQFGNIACESQVFPTYVRSLGVGSCFAFGRVGAAFGPLIGGVLLGAHVTPQNLFIFASIPLAIGFVVAMAIMPLYRRQLAGLLAQEPKSALAAEPVH
jgi:AAHS family 4-hydroxybenzoate transporter-like MFS transporter